MRKKIIAWMTGALCALVLCLPAAAANRVPVMDIQVALRTDGSAEITQTWTAETDEGTEFYLACNDNGDLTVRDFSVSDENGAYTPVESWDVNASFEEKAGRCGVLETEDGVELCWGITQYGEHRYTLHYIVEGLAGAYEDADGFNYRFVDRMGTFPTDVTLTIARQDGTPLTGADCAFWAFGFDGQIQLQNGAVCAWTEQPLEDEDNVTVLLRLNKGILNPERKGEGTFAQMQERALEGSDYSTEEEPMTALDWLLVGGMIAGAFGLVILAVVLQQKHQKAKMNRRMKRADYFRDAPNGGNLNVTYELGAGCDVCEEGSLLGAYLLRLISTGCLDSEENGGTTAVRLRLVHPPAGEDEGALYDDTLYTILEAAAGPDGILQPGELERYCKQNYPPLDRFMTACREDAMRVLRSGGCLKRADCDGIQSLTPAGKQELNEILGLKRFLLDFSLIREREVRETVIWQDYMVYAMMMGIADKVMPQIRDLYPEMAAQVEQYSSYMAWAGYYDRLMYQAYAQERERRQEERSAGHGGRASHFGGGGGFSGGGGGGTR